MVNFQEVQHLLDTGKLKESYHYSLITYCPIGEIDQSVLQSCKFYAYILHDKDLTDSGEVKESHYHLLLEFNDCRPRNPIKLLQQFKPDVYSTMIENVKSTRACVRYLCHLDQPDKMAYEVGEIFSNNTERVEKLCNDSKMRDNNDFYYDLINLDICEMAIKYGRDYIKNLSRYEEARVLLEEQIQKKSLDTYKNDNRTSLKRREAITKVFNKENNNNV